MSNQNNSQHNQSDSDSSFSEIISEGPVNKAVYRDFTESIGQKLKVLGNKPDLSKILGAKKEPQSENK